MLHLAPMSASRAAAKNVTKSNGVLPSVCDAKFFSLFGVITASDKNDRFDTSP
jgi:hypothetical protein